MQGQDDTEGRASDAPPNGAAPDGALTIDELSERSGVTVRNIRAHQHRGLLPGPILRGRVGWYGAAHLERLELIGRLQQEGFNLAAISTLLRDSDGHSDPLIDLRRRILTLPWVSEEPREYTRDQLIALMGLPPYDGSQDPSNVAARDMSVTQGTLTVLGPDRFLVHSPTLLAMCVQLAASGVPMLAITEMQETLRTASRSVAEHWVDMVGTHVWGRWIAEGRPPEQAPALLKLLEDLPAMAVQALLAQFGIELADLSGPSLLARLDSEGGGEPGEPV